MTSFHLAFFLTEIITEEIEVYKIISYFSLIRYTYIKSPFDLHLLFTFKKYACSATPGVPNVLLKAPTPITSLSYGSEYSAFGFNMLSTCRTWFLKSTSIALDR